MEKNDTINRIKREVSIYDLLVKNGNKLKKLGSGEYETRCPFPDHEDKTPSFHWHPVKNIFHCKGCGKSGSVIDYIIYLEKVNTAEAITRLKSIVPNLFGGPPVIKDDQPINGKKVSTSPLRKLEVETPNTKELIFDTKIQSYLRQYVKYYHNRFKELKEPISYLMKRGITSGELAERFKIGFCDGSFLKKSGNLDKEVMKAFITLGIFRTASARSTNHFESLNEYLIFPIINDDGIITNIYGRAINGKTTKHLYLNGPRFGVFNPSAFNHAEVIFTESIIDALSLMMLGFANVSCAYGVNGITEDVFSLLAANNANQILIAFDNDKAGERGTASFSKQLKENQISHSKITLPFKDCNEFLKKAENPSETFQTLVDSAEILFAPDKNKHLDEEKESWSRQGEEYHFKFHDRLYIVRGLENNKGNTSIKVFLRINYKNKFHIDNSVDFFNAKAIGTVVKTSSYRLDLDPGVIEVDLDKLVLTLDDLLRDHLKKKDLPKSKLEFKINLLISQKASAFLEEKLHCVRFIEDVEKCGLVGEPLVSFVCFIATLSRKLPELIHMIIQSESSAGKSTMLNLISSFIPEEDLHYFTQISPKSFYHTDEEDFMNKTIAIAESDGMDQAIYPIKQMMSEGRLSNASTNTDPQTGEHSATMKMINVHCQFMFTVPREGLDEEVQNRCLIGTLDESEEQTRRIQAIQRLLRSPEGSRMRKEKKEIIEFYQHVQREIPMLEVANRYSNYLDFASKNHRTRRDNMKYLSIIECITVFFHKQRTKMRNAEGKLEVWVHLIDIAIGHFIARRFFTTTLDELPAQTRKFLNLMTNHLQDTAKKEHVDILHIWLYRRDIQAVTNLSMTRLHEHIKRLEFHGYVMSKRDQNGFCYRLCFKPDETGETTNALNLISLDFLKKKSSKQEREEYKEFIPFLKKIFKALDPNYKDGEY